MDKLTPEQTEAILRFKSDYGRYWKARLREAWLSGTSWRKIRNDWPILLSIRNNDNLGPDWLNKVKV